MRKDPIPLAAESERGLVGRGAVVSLPKRVGSAGEDPGGVKVELNRASNAGMRGCLCNKCFIQFKLPKNG